MAPSSPPIFTLLSIGHRGVGKTVFLAGSYAELQSGKQIETTDTWFEGQDDAAQQSMHKLLAFVAQSGQYPPATLKSSDFNFTAKQKARRGEKTLCQFRWSDIPGEICHLDNPEFERMLLESHGCCVFIDAKSLVKDPDYCHTQLEETVKQVEVIASLADQSGLQYVFALILTKCDLLEAGPAKLLKIEEKLNRLSARLDAAKANYRRFYSSIPIVKTGRSGYTLKTEGASIPLLWLISELGQIHAARPAQTLESGFKQTLTNTQPRRSNDEQRPWWTQPVPVIGLGLAGLGVLAVIGMGISLLNPGTQQTPVVVQDPTTRRIQELEAALEKSPQDIRLLQELVTLYEEQKQYEPAIAYTERLIERQPQDVNLHFQLAGLQALVGRSDLEEVAYDRILAIENDNVMALTKKAILRSSAGDLTLAKELFNRAEQAAPDVKFKQTIRDVAEQWVGES